MKKALALPVFSVALMVGQSALAANVFVATARGADLARADQEKITGMVRRSVENMPEHTLVQSESEADFVLQPAVVRREEGQILRIEKTKDGDLIAVAEQPVDMASSSANAQSVTQTALQSDTYVTQANAGGSRHPASAEQSVASDSTTASSGLSADTSDTRTIHSQPAASSNVTTDSGMSDEMADMAPTTGSLMDDDTTMTDMAADTSGTGSGMSSGSSLDSTSQDAGVAAGDVRASSPKIASGIPGFFQVGFGPAFAIGLDSDNIMYNINASYNYNISEQLTAKGFGDFNFGTGADSAQMINLGAAAEVYPQNFPTFGDAQPYLIGDLGYGFARNAETNATGDGVTVGAGAGFKFAARQLNWDINAHYAVLTTQIDGNTPSVLGIRAALNF